MAKYQAVIDLDVNTQDLEVAYAEAERLVSAGAAALGRAKPFLTVAALVDPMPRTATRFSVTAELSGAGYPKGSTASIVFDPAAGVGAVIIDDTMGAVSAQLTPESLRWLVRGLMVWPLDLLDDMAREDELKRRSGGGR